MEATFATLVRDVRSAEDFEGMLAGSGVARSRSTAAAAKSGQRAGKLAKTSATNPLTASVGVDPIEAAAERVKRVMDAVHEARKRQRPDEAHDCSDDVLSEMARYTDSFALKSYERFLHYIPRIVNVARLLVD